MPPDEITQRHLQKLRIRGAPSDHPRVGRVRRLLRGRGDLAPDRPRPGRPADQGPDRHLSGASLSAAFERLAAAAAAQKLSVVEEPLFALKGDPTEDPPHKWEYEAILPIRGAAKAEDGFTLSRIEGGMHIFTVTPRGLPDLKNVYVYLFGKFMPAKKQQFMRPYILHRVLEGNLGSNPAAHATHASPDDALVIGVYVPAVLSIKPVPIPGEGGEA